MKKSLRIASLVFDAIQVLLCLSIIALILKNWHSDESDE